MKLWSLGQISPQEKNDILSQHKEIYNGYKTMQPDVPNTQPLYVQSFANDKGGLVVTNKGEVKTYRNFGINESTLDESVCNECGGRIVEGECSECGMSNEAIEDLSKDAKFDYTESDDFYMESAWDAEIDEQDISGVQGIYGSMKKPYNFQSDGPGGAGPYQTSSYESELDETLSESVKQQRLKVINMHNRMSKYS